MPVVLQAEGGLLAVTGQEAGEKLSKEAMPELIAMETTGLTAMLAITREEMEACDAERT